MISTIFDPDSNAAKIYLDGPIAPGGVAFSYPCDPAAVGGMINLDFDGDGRLIAIEVLGASAMLPRSVLIEAERDH